MKRSPIQCFELEEWFRSFAFRPGMVNLSPSNPISPTIGELLDLAGASIADVSALSLDYSQTAGASPTREGVAALYEDLDLEHVVVTSGATEAILLTLEAVIDAGTRVVVEYPLYGIYEPLLELLGAEIVRCELRAADGYDYDFASLEHLVRAHRAELMIVNPYNNPTGHGVTSEQALQTLVEISDRTSCRIWSDDVFRFVALDGVGLRSPLDLKPDAISVGDMTKAWGLGGLRIGWLACRDEEVIERALNTRDYTSNSNSIVSERLAEYALSVRGALLDSALNVARAARLAVDRFIRDSRGALSWIPPIGGYCGWIEVHVDDPSSVTELCATLTKQRNYLVLPGSVFGPTWNGFIRIGLSAGSENLLRGLDALVTEAGLR